MNGVCAVVVSYNPGEYLATNVIAVARQVDEIVVVDNGSTKASSRKTLSEVEKISNAKVIYNSENLGIAAALNIGVKYAIRAGYQWIVTFDQDSRAGEGFIDSLLEAYEVCGLRDVAIVAPRYYDPLSGRLITFCSRGKEGGGCNGVSEVDSTMTSGNLLHADIFEKVGWFDEGLFIDYVDHEFCLRCWSRGFRVVESRSAILQHTVGLSRVHRLLGREVVTSNHSAARWYYIARNRVVVWRRYLLFGPLWVIRDIVGLVKQVAKVVLLEEDVAAKVRCIVGGMRDGFLGRLGRGRARLM